MLDETDNKEDLLTKFLVVTYINPIELASVPGNCFSSCSLACSRDCKTELSKSKALRTTFDSSKTQSIGHIMSF